MCLVENSFENWYGPKFRFVCWICMKTWTAKPFSAEANVSQNVVFSALFGLYSYFLYFLYFTANEHWPKMIKKKSRSTCAGKCGFLTNVYCTACNKFLCFTSERNCFRRFHRKNGLTQEHMLEFHDESSRSRCFLNCNKPQPSSLTKAYCSKCQLYLCFNHTRNCFVKHHF